MWISVWQNPVLIICHNTVKTIHFSTIDINFAVCQKPLANTHNLRLDIPAYGTHKIYLLPRHRKRRISRKTDKQFRYSIIILWKPPKIHLLRRGSTGGPGSDTIYLCEVTFLKYFVCESWLQPKANPRSPVSLLASLSPPFLLRLTFSSFLDQFTTISLPHGGISVISTISMIWNHYQRARLTYEQHYKQVRVCLLCWLVCRCIDQSQISNTKYLIYFA